MTRTQLNHGVFGVLFLMAGLANAQEYPAADFQPKVIYQDETIARAPETKAAAVEPAPCVNQNAPAKQESAADAFDPNYPASNFQPKVLFSDAN